MGVGLWCRTPGFVFSDETHIANNIVDPPRATQLAKHREYSIVCGPRQRTYLAHHGLDRCPGSIHRRFLESGGDDTIQGPSPRAVVSCQNVSITIRAQNNAMLGGTSHQSDVLGALSAGRGSAQ